MRNLTLAGGLLLAGLAWQAGPPTSSAVQGMGSTGGPLRTAVSQPRLPYNHPIAMLCRHYSTAEPPAEPAGYASASATVRGTGGNQILSTSIAIANDAAGPKCSDVGCTSGIPANLESLLVTVPDPERTHL